MFFFLLFFFVICVYSLIRVVCFFFFFSSRRRHTRCGRDWSSDVCSSDLESGVPRSAANAPENPNMPWAIESRVASSENVGAAPGCQAKWPRPAGTRHARHASRSALARASRPSEASEPSSLRSKRAEPASGAVSATSPPGSLSASAAPPASQPTSGSSALRLSASQSSASWLRVPRTHPTEPDPVVTRPACATGKESPYSRRSANRTRTAPESTPAPASRWLEDRLHRPERRHRAVAHKIAPDGEAQA